MAVEVDGVGEGGGGAASLDYPEVELWGVSLWYGEKGGWKGERGKGESTLFFSGIS